jgi:signal transduction histidine kinase
MPVYNQATTPYVTNHYENRSNNRIGGRVFVQIEEAKEDPVRLSISDTGMGIPMKRQSELFKPFSRIGAESTNIEGTGIGLVVCKKLVELMNLWRTNKTGELELFNLATDLSETENLAGKYPEKAQQLLEQLRDWIQEIDATQPSPLSPRGRR